MELRAAAQQILFIMMLQIYLGSGEFSQSEITTLRCCTGPVILGGLTYLQVQYGQDRLDYF